MEAGRKIVRDTYKIRKCIYLNTTVPFHCPLMASAAKELKIYLEKVTFGQARCPLISNVTATDIMKSSSEEMKDLLVQHMTKPVLWSQSIDYVLENTRDEAVFCEMGRGRILTGLIRQHEPKTSCVYVIFPDCEKK